MKKSFLLFLLIFSLCCIGIFARQSKESYISKKELIGTWQKDYYRVGNGLNQNFQFFDNGRFVLNVGNFGDDAVSTTKLMGRYRLIEDKIFFTITSKTIVDGELEMIDPGIDHGIFAYGLNSKIKEVKEVNPKEMVDPCFITYIKRGKIKLNNEVYYKVSVQSNER